MVTVRETQKVQNDNTRHVAAHSPGAKKVRIEWLKTTTANIHPGMPIIRGTGAGGEATATESGAGSNVVYGIVELDKKQITLCTDTYASGDLIPVITIEGNDGLICRNIFITDPDADILPDSGFIAGAAVFVVESGLDRVYLRSEYFIANADDPDRVVARISQSLSFADA